MSIKKPAFWLLVSFLVLGQLTVWPLQVRAQAVVGGTKPAMAIQQPVSINQASLEELEQVKGIGPALAERIVSYREANGKFKTVDQIKEVKGIGEAKFAKIKEQITL